MKDAYGHAHHERLLHPGYCPEVYFINQLNAKKMAEASKKTLTEAECEYIALFVR